MIEEEKAVTTAPCLLVEYGDDKEVQVVSIPKEEDNGEVDFGEDVIEEKKKEIEAEEKKSSFRLSRDIVAKPGGKSKSIVPAKYNNNLFSVNGLDDVSVDERIKRSKEVGLFGGINVSPLGKLILVGLGKVLDGQINNQELQTRLCNEIGFTPHDGAMIYIKPYEFTKMIYDQSKPPKQSIDGVKEFIRNVSKVEIIEEYNIFTENGMVRVKDTDQLFLKKERSITWEDGREEDVIILWLRGRFVNGLLYNNYISLPSNVFKILGQGKRTNLKQELYFLLAERANDRKRGMVDKDKVRTYEINKIDLVNRLLKAAERYKRRPSEFKEKFNDAINDLKEAGLIIEYSEEVKNGALYSIFKLNAEHAKKIIHIEKPNQAPKKKRGRPKKNK